MVTANTRLRLVTRTWVGQKLTQIFGSSASTAVNALVLAQNAAFGGPCDIYNGVFKGYEGYFKQETVGGDCPSMADTQDPMVPSPSSARAAFMIRTCDLIVSQDAAVYNAAGLAEGVTGLTSLSAAPTSTQINALYSLFYDQTPDPSEITALASVSAQATSLGYPAIESWRFVLQTLCNAPDWQVP